MLKRVTLLLTLMLTLPAFAHAWTISARVMAGQGSIADGATVLKSNVGGTVTGPGYESISNSTPSAALTVTADAANGYSIDSVVIDGQVATAPYTVNYNGTNSHTINAYFKKDKVTVTSTQAANGMFTIQQIAPTTTGATTGSLSVKPGSTIKITATPKTGYVLGSITVNGSPVSGNPATYVVNAATTVSASFTQTAAVSISGLTTAPVALLDTASVNLTVTATGNAAAGTLSYSVAVTDDATGAAAKLSDGSVAVPVFTANVAVLDKKTVGYSTYYFPAGSYTATVTVTGATGGSASKSISFIKQNALIYASSSCTGCHSNSTPDIVTNWTNTKHAESAGHDSGKCFRCHNAKGYLFAQNTAYTGDVTTILTANGGTYYSPDATAPTPISCSTCHTDSPHDGALRPIAGWDPNGNGVVDQFDVCTSCHTLENASGMLNHFHTDQSANSGRVISDTHYDNPATAAGQGNESATVINKVEGYNVRWNGATPCADCHDLHKAEARGATASGEQTLQQQWARSGHAGKILAKKEAWLKANGTLDATSGYYFAKTNPLIASLTAVYTNDADAQAWTHYAWSNSTGVANQDRKDCQRCHTATGASNYLTSPATYNAANNDFSHLAQWATAKTSPQNEVLYCWGCHVSVATGELRAPGAITAEYNFHGAKAVFPNVQGSNICIACHSGRAGGENVTALSTAPTTNWANVSFQNSHYMAAAGLMYVKIGYTNFVPPQTAIAGATGSAAISYGQSLTADIDTTVDKTGATVPGKVTSTHRKLGTSAIIGDHGITAAMGLDSNGPCVTCHYPQGEHTLEFEATNYNAVCINCHTKEGLTPLTASNYKSAFIEPQGEVFQDALSLALKVLKDNYNISYDQAAYPYFYDDNKAGGHITANAVKDWTRGGALTAAQAEKLMGACFNINVLKRDPAAYAHARTYVRRLVYDTIDFLDNKTIDQSVGTTALNSSMKDANNNDIFTKGGKAFNSAPDPAPATTYTVTDVASGTSEAMTYLLGWVRSGTATTAGAWNAWERP